MRPRHLLPLLLLALQAVPAAAQAPAPDLSERDRARLMKAYDAYKGMTAEKKTLLWERHRRLKQFGPGERREVFRNYRKFKRMPPRDRRMVRENYRRFKSLPKAQRARLRKLFRRIMKLPPHKRKALFKKLKAMKGRK